MADQASESIAPARTFVSVGSVRVGVVALLLACTLGARLPGLLHYALWQDEVGAERVIAKPTLRGAVRQVIKRESTPPTFYLMARVVDRAVTGLKPASRARAARGLSIAFSLGCTALTLALAFEFLPLWVAAVAGLLVSFGSALVIHGSELRAYSLLAFACIAFAIVLAWAVAQPRLGRLVLLAGAVALGSMTHYFFLFTFAAGVLWLLTTRTRRTVVRVGAALAVGLIPLAVWSPYWLRQYRHHGFATAPPFSFARFVELLPSLFVPEQVVRDTPEVISIVVTLAVLASAVFLLRRPGVERLCGLCVLVPFVVVGAGVWITHDRVYNVRNQIGLTPFVAIALAWGCAAVPWKSVSYASAALAGAAVLAGFAYSQIDLGRTPYDHIASDMVAQGFQRDEPVVWFGSYGGILPVAWYLTPDDRANAWPRIFISAPTGKPCSAVEVVVRSKTGRQWLARHRGAILAQTSLPSYGDTVQAGRVHDMIIARLRWSRGILDRPKGAQAWFRFHRADTRSPCLQH